MTNHFTITYFNIQRNYILIRAVLSDVYHLVKNVYMKINMGVSPYHEFHQLNYTPSF